MGKRYELSYPHLSDEAITHKVRMPMRADLGQGLLS